MAGDEEVVVDARNFIAGHGGVDDRRIVGAEWAFEVLELNDGNLCAGWRLEERGVSEGRCGLRTHRRLRGGGQREKKSDGGEKGAVHSSISYNARSVADSLFAC